VGFSFPWEADSNDWNECNQRAAIAAGLGHARRRVPCLLGVLTADPIPRTPWDGFFPDCDDGVDWL
jgi:hypothetical protein